MIAFRFGSRRSEQESRLARGGEAASSPARRAATTMLGGGIGDGGGSFMVMVAAMDVMGEGGEIGLPPRSRGFLSFYPNEVRIVVAGNRTHEELRASAASPYCGRQHN